LGGAGQRVGAERDHHDPRGQRDRRGERRQPGDAPPAQPARRFAGQVAPAGDGHWAGVDRGIVEQHPAFERLGDIVSQVGGRLLTRQGAQRGAVGGQRFE
jgi:hypothetical protein